MIIRHHRQQAPQKRVRNESRQPPNPPAAPQKHGSRVRVPELRVPDLPRIAQILQRDRERLVHLLPVDSEAGRVEVARDTTHDREHAGLASGHDQVARAEDADVRLGDAELLAGLAEGRVLQGAVAVVQHAAGEAHLSEGDRSVGFREMFLKSRSGSHRWSRLKWTVFICYYGFCE